MTTIPLIFLGSENRGGLKILPVALENRVQNAETKADGFALDALDRTRYDERALISVFRGWDTQVPVDDSIRARAEASTDIVVVDSSEFQRIRSILRALAPHPSRTSSPSLGR